ncbi:MAG: DUF2127 domain-containing protein [Anaerolineales bacterium]|nr:DUF2127 domain-containing protein [Anaerolineales bacterium]
MEQSASIVPRRTTSHPKLIRAAAILQSLYALIEVLDCFTAGLMAVGLITNPYPTMLFKEIQTLFDSQPIWLVPLFLFYTSLRVTSAIGLWRNRMWGFWLTIFASTATLIMAPFLLPFTTVEMLLNGILIIVLLIGFFGDTPITRSFTLALPRKDESHARLD